jgi:hypothetical protein
MFFNKTIKYIKIFLLWFNNFIKLRRGVYVSDVKLLDPIVYSNNLTQIYWNSKGIYKIKVENVGTFPGNRNCLPIIIKKDTCLRFIFYGIGKKIEKTLDINPVNVFLPQLSQINNAEIERHLNLTTDAIMPSGINEFKVANTNYYVLLGKIIPSKNLELKTNINLKINKKELYETRFLYNS